jgi:hypothetical protein
MKTECHIIGKDSPESDQGVTNYIGIQGYTGLQGYTGFQGDTGWQGVQGATGYQGMTGGGYLGIGEGAAGYIVSCGGGGSGGDSGSGGGSGSGMYLIGLDQGDHSWSNRFQPLPITGPNNSFISFTVGGTATLSNSNIFSCVIGGTRPISRIEKSFKKMKEKWDIFWNKLWYA